MKVILASASPRRNELLQQIGIEPIVCPASYDEESGTAVQASEVAVHNAVGKCRAVAVKQGDALPIVAADTIVVIDNDILGKPADAQEALKMLQRLSGRQHIVMTGVAVQYKGQEKAFCVETKVFFRSLSQAELEAYIATGEPMDKAGAYGIQGRGAILVDKIEGCYNNVVGLPLTKLYEVLTALGVQG